MTKEYIAKIAYGSGFDPLHVDLAKQLIAEMEKKKVWDCAPDDAIKAEVSFWSKPSGTSTIYPWQRVGATSYHRELPKTREREIAEEMFNATENIDACEEAILKAKREWEEGRK